MSNTLDDKILVTDANFNITNSCLSTLTSKHDNLHHAASSSKLTTLRGDKSLEVVASAIGISTTALLAYESGIRIPRDDIKQRLAAFYGVSMSELFKREFTVEDAMEFHDALQKIDADQFRDFMDVVQSLAIDKARTTKIMADAYRLERLRRTAKQNGIHIVRQSGLPIGDSGYQLLDAVAGVIVAGDKPPYSLTLNDVDGWISCMEG